MNNCILNYLQERSKLFSTLIQEKNLLVKGSHIGERTFLVNSYKNPLLYVVSSLSQVQEVRRIFESFGKRVKVLSSCVDSLSFTMADSLAEQEILEVLQSVASKQCDIVVAYAGVLAQKVPDPKSYAQNALNLEVGANYTAQSIVSRLVCLGYSKVEIVEQVGDFRFRGDTLDVYLPYMQGILRAEFFGDELESLKIVNQKDYVVIKKCDNATIFPNVLVLDDKVLEEQNNFKNIYYLPQSETCRENIFCWFRKNFIVLDEPSRIWGVYESEYRQMQEDVLRRVVGEVLPKGFKDFYVSPTRNMLVDYTYLLSFESLDVQNPFYFPKKSLYLSCPSNLKYQNDLTQFYKDIEYFDRQNFTIIICVENPDSANLVHTRLQDMKRSAKIVQDKILANAINIVVYDLEQNFGFLDDKVVILGTKHFDGYKNNKVEKVNKSRVFYLPQVGDYVVHELYGVAKCIEVSRQNFGISEKDYFVLKYANDDTLYVPTEHVDELSSYIGEKEPKLDVLGSNNFAKAKAKAKESVKKLAHDLKKLYAIRDSKKGFAYEINEELIQEFVDSFGFELTPDQTQCIEDVKRDMSSGKIMDRLICGDVGFGKTEVALVSSFISVLNCKQVALLAPTSVLCHQHFTTFTNRLREFGVKVGELSRFKTNKENADTISKLIKGEIQIVCCTKRLLSKDVAFKDLGLLIVDEEQRFGVNDKEQIKDMRKDISVLTLSATPIPRTLNMSLMGVRDISLITTPPKNRQSVQSVVCEENDAYLAEACEKELARGGQVLVIYNRVEDIFLVANRISKLLPNVVFGVAHGQMSRQELEREIMKLYDRKTQILVATTLIENGVDLPMANTLIVLDADRFGLGQLYQLKGRVGRGERKAYAYFMYRKGKELSSVSYERLKAIKDFSSLGSGFKLSMRDLELRGAGDVLGANQHGHIAKLGYDMYCKLLEEALQEINGEQVSERKEVKIEVGAPAYIPHEYIHEEDQRIKVYNQISQINALEDVYKIAKNLTEMYGNIPIEMQELMQIALIKNISQSRGVRKIIIKQNFLNIEFYEDVQGDLEIKLAQMGCKKDLINKKIYKLVANMSVDELQKALLVRLFDVKNKVKC